eukprot:3234206-Rhodomonas_salina.1
MSCRACSKTSSSTPSQSTCASFHRKDARKRAGGGEDGRTGGAGGAGVPMVHRLGKVIPVWLSTMFFLHLFVSCSCMAFAFGFSSSLTESITAPHRTKRLARKMISERGRGAETGREGERDTVSAIPARLALVALRGGEQSPSQRIHGKGERGDRAAAALEGSRERRSKRQEGATLERKHKRAKKKLRGDPANKKKRRPTSETLNGGSHASRRMHEAQEEEEQEASRRAEKKKKTFEPAKKSHNVEHTKKKKKKKKKKTKKEQSTPQDAPSPPEHANTLSNALADRSGGQRLSLIHI